MSSCGQQKQLQIHQEPLRQQYHNVVGHRLVITAYQSDARTQARGPTIPGNIQPLHRSAPSFTSTGMWLHLQWGDCSCHGLRGRSGSTRRLYSPTLQHLLDLTSTFLETCGLLLNTSKCHTVSIDGNGGLRKTVVDANRIFHIKGQPLRALSREDS